MNAANLIDTLLARPQARWFRDTASGGSALATGIVVSVQELEELRAALPANLPGALWCLHVLGMDDVHPAPSKAHAEKAAAWHNEQFKDQAARLGISIEARVAAWPHSAESHAAGVGDFIPQWLIPQWQLDALQSEGSQSIPAADHGQQPQGIRLIEIPRRNFLDPINVFVQDYELGRGRIVVTCYGQAWCAFWGAMGNRTVMQFVAGCDVDYVAGNMLQGRQTRITKREREYTARIAAEVISEFQTLLGVGK
ncbi:hypothetical protein [Stenotrophomonas maltophilia]|uniref:hypothetical protein n=1 Tax=Stenotrophomonas maltophilia TaxID=40324 RepID=UPI0021C7BF22|nr:hypothetical protein [Stenotrophomonas maltophilia]MCU1145752.1 hypothetical protein [Stenotrophomonas maltophilia]